MCDDACMCWFMYVCVDVSAHVPLVRFSYYCDGARTLERM